MFNRSLTVLSVLAMMAPIASAQVRWKPYDPAVVAPQGACSVALSVPQDRIATERQISTQEINPYFGPYWLVFNVIEAVFASGREREAQRNILPIRAALEGDDTAARFHQALSRARSSLPCLVEGDVVRAEGAKPARNSPAFTLDGTGMLWLVRVRYSMSSDSRYLTAHATSTLLPAEARGLLTEADQRRLADLTLYQNQFTYTRKLNAVGTSAELAALWTADAGKPIRSGLDEIAEGIVALMMADISTAIEGQPAAHGQEFELKVAGRNVTVRRDADGSLVAITP
jgi:hypothetical protein